MNSAGRSRVFPLTAVHSVYKRLLSPLLHAGAGMLGGACRFQPTCSEYANIAIHEYGLLHGGWMALKRLLRCHPGCAGGYDPVPPKSGFTHTHQSQLP